MTEKILIFDAGPIINFTMNGLNSILEKLKTNFNGKFIITEDVKYEVIDRPLNIKRFELGAITNKELLQKKVFDLPSSIGISNQDIERKTNEIIEKTNNSFYSKEEPMHLIDKGEASCLALSLLASEKGIKNLIAIDERTTRLLIENPENLRRILESRLHEKIKVRKIPELIKNIKFIRSAELIYLAYKLNLFEIKDKNLLDALLYSVKFKGCSISGDEIREIKKLP